MQQISTRTSGPLDTDMRGRPKITSRFATCIAFRGAFVFGGVARFPKPRDTAEEASKLSSTEAFRPALGGLTGGVCAKSTSGAQDPPEFSSGYQSVEATEERADAQPPPESSAGYITVEATDEQADSTDDARLPPVFRKYAAKHVGKPAHGEGAGGAGVSCFSTIGPQGGGRTSTIGLRGGGRTNGAATPSGDSWDPSAMRATSVSNATFLTREFTTMLSALEHLRLNGPVFEAPRGVEEPPSIDKTFFFERYPNLAYRPREVDIFSWYSSLYLFLGVSL